MVQSSRPPPLRLHPAHPPEVAVVFDSPHSGEIWPENFRPAAPASAVRTTCDVFVNQLCSAAPSHGIALLEATFPRAYIDVNRAESDIDPELLSGPWPGPVTLSDYSRRGMGLIRRHALPGVPMYDRRLSIPEVQGRFKDYYAPYRTTLQRMIDEVHGRHGVVWHINWHSMKSRGNAMNTDAGEARPDFVVSDREGRTADPALTRWIASWFESLGNRVAINHPYRGGDLIATTGRPEQGRHSVQIEINRALYVDESTYNRHEGFTRIQQLIGDFSRALAAHCRHTAHGSAHP